MKRWSVALLLALPCACSSHPAPRPRPEPISLGAVEALLEDQRQAWNRGDWAGFIAGYWDHPKLTFNGASGITRGRRDLLQRFQQSYPDPESRGVLTFYVLQLRAIGRDGALVLGRFHLDRASPTSGYFSLVVERTRQGIKITHDHTSESPRQ